MLQIVRMTGERYNFTTHKNTNTYWDGAIWKPTDMICLWEEGIFFKSLAHSNPFLVYIYSPGGVYRYYLCSERDALWV